MILVALICLFVKAETRSYSLVSENDRGAAQND